jgi:hypothetical protein
MWVAGGLLVALAAVAVLVAIAMHRVEPFLRAEIVERLQKHFHARVEMDSFHVSFRDGVRAEGEGLRIWPSAKMLSREPGAGDDPLIRLDEFHFRAPLHYKAGEPIHISEMQLRGLVIHVPPQPPSLHPAQGESAAGSEDASRTADAGAAGAGSQGAPGAAKPKGSIGWLSFVVDKMECTGAELVLETSKPGKLPLDFAIAHLALRNLTSGKAMEFDAELTNPRPVGKIHSTGSFGPWVVDDPGESPVIGDFTFDHADLATFKGIAGILNSTGHYQGTLRDIVVDGETETPDFRLTDFGNAMALHTRFHAKVDGTNGDTWLEPVEATLGHSHFTAQGQVMRVVVTENGAEHSVGHDIALNVNVDQGRIEDFLRLASRTATPLLTGELTLRTALHIPPGAAPVHERMTLKGTFHLDQAQFASTKVQDGIRQLSLRGLGRPKEVKTTDAASIRSEMDGSFAMAGGAVTLPALEYTVPGAQIQLAGDYGLKGGTLDFTGYAKMQATVSEMVGGWKGLLLKPADRLFKKDGVGTEVPIHIRGTHEAPEFGIDFDRMRRKPAQK